MISPGGISLCKSWKHDVGVKFEIFFMPGTAKFMFESLGHRGNWFPFSI